MCRWTAGYATTPTSRVAATSQPDDYSPRDRMGHGTAIAMIAAGVQNTGPLGTIQGVAPKAFLGNYKIFGSPGRQRIHQLSGGARRAGRRAGRRHGRGDALDDRGRPEHVLRPARQSCRNAAASATSTRTRWRRRSRREWWSWSAGNDGNIGLRHADTQYHPSSRRRAIGDHGGRADEFACAVPDAARRTAQNIRALFSDGPQAGARCQRPLRDVAKLGNDGLGCAALPAGSLAGAVALIQRGTCFYSDKINNAQNAGAIAVVIYQAEWRRHADSRQPARRIPAIPAVLIGNSDGSR